MEDKPYDDEVPHIVIKGVQEANLVYCLYCTICNKISSGNKASARRIFYHQHRKCGEKADVKRS